MHMDVPVNTENKVNYEKSIYSSAVGFEDIYIIYIYV